jgi:hypothetical protein
MCKLEERSNIGDLGVDGRIIVSYDGFYKAW